MRETPPLHLETDGLVIDDDREASRYAAHLADAAPRDEPSIAAYMFMGEDAIVFTHTEVPRALEGRGVAARLVKAALDDARTRELLVVPMCPYVQSFLRRHREYWDIVAPGYRERLGEPARADD